MHWLLLVTLLTLLRRSDLKECSISDVRDLDDPTSCNTFDEVEVDEKNVDLQRDPRLFEKLRNATAIRTLSLHNTNLKKIVDAPVLLILSNSIFEIVDNDDLEELPRLNFTDIRTTTINVRGNPKLDTQQLQADCAALKCSDFNKNYVQKSFTCPLKRPIRKVCRVIEDDVDLTDFEEAYNEAQAVVGSLILRGSNVTEFPRMRNLRALKQKGESPVLIIEGNPNLASLSALYDVRILLSPKTEPMDAVLITNNPKLCVTLKMSIEPFVIEFLTRVPRCVNLTLHVPYMIKGQPIGAHVQMLQMPYCPSKVYN